MKDCPQPPTGCIGRPHHQLLVHLHIQLGAWKCLEVQVIGCSALTHNKVVGNLGHDGEGKCGDVVLRIYQTRKVSRPPAGQFSSTCAGLVAFSHQEGPSGPLWLQMLGRPFANNFI